jgi:hypothetical protein
MFFRNVAGHLPDYKASLPPPKNSTRHTDSCENLKSGADGTLITLPTIGHKYFTCHTVVLSLPSTDRSAKGAFPVARAHVCCVKEEPGVAYQSSSHFLTGTVKTCTSATLPPREQRLGKKPLLLRVCFVNYCCMINMHGRYYWCGKKLSKFGKVCSNVLKERV